MEKFAKNIQAKWSKTPLVIMLVSVVALCLMWLNFQNQITRDIHLAETISGDYTAMEKSFYGSLLDLGIDHKTGDMATIGTRIGAAIFEEYKVTRPATIFDATTLPKTNQLISSILKESDAETKYKNHFLVTSKYDIITTYRMYNSEGKLSHSYASVLDYIKTNLSDIVSSDSSMFIVNTEDPKVKYQLGDIVDMGVAGNKMESIYIITIMKIKPDTDIFGLPDYDTYGYPIKNNKIVLMNVVSVNDLVTEYYPIQREIYLYQNRIDTEFEKEKAVTCFIYLITAIFVSIIFVAVIFIDILVKRCKNRC